MGSSGRPAEALGLIERAAQLAPVLLWNPRHCGVALVCAPAAEGVPYEVQMDEAGFLLPSTRRAGERRRLPAFAIGDLMAEEEEQLLEYLAILRSRSRS